MATGDFPPSTDTALPCPACGHCPTCGHGGPTWPVYPTYPNYPTYPWWPQVVNTGYTTAPLHTVTY